MNALTHLAPPIGSTWPAFALQLYPWWFEFAAIAFFKHRGWMPEIGPRRLAVSAVLSLANLILLFRGYGYEAQIYQEMLVPIVLLFPYLRAQVRSLPRLGLLLLPLTVFALIEQLKCTQLDQWSYISEGNRYLIWARQRGTVLERLLWFGGQDYPLAELEFYVLYIVGLFTWLCALTSIFRRWTTPLPGLAWFFPAAFGIPAAVLVPLIAWYVVAHRSIPMHAVSAGMSLAFMWIFRSVSPRARAFVRSPLFACVTVFSFFQTAIFETYHVARGHWYYKPENELASLHPWIDWTFPSIPWLDIAPRAWALEEFCAYGGLWVFTYTMALTMDEKFKLGVFE